MEKTRLIVECKIDKALDNRINSIGKIIYSIPMINSYVVELPVQFIGELKAFAGITSVSNCSVVTAQQKKPSGKGITMAFIDTGISPLDDFLKPVNRLLRFVDFIGNRPEPYDDNAHGTHVTGIAAGNGYCSGGEHKGIAPDANIISLKALDKNGSGNSGDMLAALQWVYDNKEEYGIRIANLSIGTEDIGRNDPLVRACEALWDNGVVVIAAAGNNGPKPQSVTSPGISRKIITVGASDDNSEVNIRGTKLVNFSGRGPTMDCIVKPDIIAPGSKIISCLSTTPNLGKRQEHEFRIVSDNYVEMSGTSMAAPSVSGAVALLLEIHPGLSPNEVKLRLKHSAKNMNYPKNQQGWGLLDIEKLIGEEKPL